MNWRKYLKNALDSIAKKKHNKFALDKNNTLNIT